MITIAFGAVRLQLAAFRHSPGDLLTLLSVPLFTAMFLTIMRHAGRDDLAAYAVLAPGVIAVWQMALFVSGELVDKDRSLGTLEALLATPGPLGLVILVLGIWGWVRAANREWIDAEHGPHDTGAH